MKNKNFKKYYNGLPGIRNAGYQEPLEEWQIKEIIKCALDPIYFIEKYIKIVSKPDDRFKTVKKLKKSKALIPFILRDYQKNLILKYYKNNRLIIKFPRQGGKSVTIQAIAVHLSIFTSFKDIAILANKDRSAKLFLGKIKLMIKNLPFWMQPGIREWNKGTIQFDNDSTITSAATSADGIRGDSITDLIVDEMGFVDNNMWLEFYASVYPTVSADEDAKITFISTPNGMNHFYKFWQDAIHKISSFIPIYIKWDDVPGRDEAWKIKTISDVGERLFAQEYMCEFLGSGGTLISSVGLTSLGISSPIEITESDHFRIFKYPEKNHMYLAIDDVGEGIGEDSSTIQIIDVTNNLLLDQVAIYDNNTVSTDDFPAVIEQLAVLYNDALVIGENNSWGSDVLTDLVYDFEYENVFYNSEEDKHRHGIRMTTKSKKIGNAYLKRNIEDGRLDIHDEKTIFELSTYVKKGNSYQADKDNHDDTVTPLVHLSYFMKHQDWVEDWLNIDINIEDRRKALQAQIEDDIMPAGFVNRGFGVQDLNDKESVDNSYIGGYF
jgi:hypothetical protein